MRLPDSHFARISLWQYRHGDHRDDAPHVITILSWKIGNSEHKKAHSQETNIDYAMKIISKKRLIKRSGFLRKPPPRMRNSTGTSKGEMIF